MEKVIQFLKLAARNLRTRPLRSWLTIIGVVVGVFLVVSLLSMTEGLKSAITQQLQMIGKDIIIVMPGEITNFATTFAGGLELSDEDIEAVKKAKGVEAVLPMNYKGESVRFEDAKKTVFMTGVPMDEKGLDVLVSDMGWSLVEGEWPNRGKREVIIGHFVSQDIFSGIEVGDEMTIAGKKFKVSGVLRSLGNKQDDTSIMISLSVFRSITGERKGAKQLLAKAKADYSTDEVVENIKENLKESRRRRRGEDLPSFTVLSSEKVIEIVGNIIGMIQVAVFALASIAILVGAIGIMNTMYTSVHERIREIGVMKAIGAKTSTIRYIFLFEAGIVGLIGGVGGVALGIGLAKAVELYFIINPIFLLKASASPWLILFGLFFSFLVGCISGFLPARAASKLNPVDALRYE